MKIKKIINKIFSNEKDLFKYAVSEFLHGTLAFLVVITLAIIGAMFGKLEDKDTGSLRKIFINFEKSDKIIATVFIAIIFILYILYRYFKKRNR
jgi:membrane protein DedA with SNARE-associated domain